MSAMPPLALPISTSSTATVVIVLLVQRFVVILPTPTVSSNCILYAYRVWLLSGYHHGVLGYLVRFGHGRGLFLVVLVGLLSLSLFFESESDTTIFTPIGIVLSYETYTISTWSQAARIAWTVEASFAVFTAIDMIISVAINFYCRTAYLRGVLSCLFTFILMPNNLVFLALSYLLTRPAPAPLYSATSQSHVWRAVEGTFGQGYTAASTVPLCLPRRVYRAQRLHHRRCLSTQDDYSTIPSPARVGAETAGRQRWKMLTPAS
ncbi:hypothetical protein B0H13DRAFT_2328560 [Mycena leptocephala]|nr:hypothetical protein B0H13DRAFT_2328560 [Mycena leptocephala]